MGAKARWINGQGRKGSTRILEQGTRPLQTLLVRSYIYIRIGYEYGLGGARRILEQRHLSVIHGWFDL